MVPGGDLHEKTSAGNTVTRAGAGTEEPQGQMEFALRQDIQAAGTRGAWKVSSLMVVRWGIGNWGLTGVADS